LARVDPGPLDDLAVTAAEQLVRVRVLVVALLLVSAPDRGADRLDDDYLAAVAVAHRCSFVVNGDVLYPRVEERLGIAGSGAIACGLAVTAAQLGDVLRWARSGESAERARETIAKSCAKLGDEADPGRVTVVTDLDALNDATFVVEAVIEHHGHKAA